MADRDIPQFENYPEIYLQISTSAGILPTTGGSAPDEITLIVEGGEADWEIPAVGIDHTDTANVRTIKGKPVACNVKAAIPAGFSDVLDEFNCKAELVMDASSDPPRVMYAPTAGVFTLQITANVRGADGLPAASGSGE